MDLPSPTLSRTDAMINADWDTAAPTASMGADTFSARWTGQVEAPATGTYTFHTNADDGVRLWVNGQLVVDNWSDRTLAGDVNKDGKVDTIDFGIVTSNFTKTGMNASNGDLTGDGKVDQDDLVVIAGNWAQSIQPQENSGTIALQAGKRYDVKVEYYDNAGDASVQLLWTRPDAAKSVVPTSALFPTAPITPVPDAAMEFTLINASTGATIGALKSGDTLDLSKLPTKNLSVIATPSGSAGSVVFGMDSNAKYRVENVVPYALMGDSGGTSFGGFTPTVGKHAITATAFSSTGGAGTNLGSTTVNFTVVDSAPAPTPTPTPIPPPTPTPTPIPTPTPVPDTSGPADGKYEFTLAAGQSISSIAPKPGDDVYLTGNWSKISFPWNGTTSAPIHVWFADNSTVGQGQSGTVISGGTYLDIHNMHVTGVRSPQLQAEGAAVKIYTGTRLVDAVIEKVEAVGLAIYGRDVTVLRTKMDYCGQMALSTQFVNNVLIKDCVIAHSDNGFANPLWAGKSNTFQQNGLWYVDPGWEGGAMKIWESHYVTIDNLDSGFNRGSQGWCDYKNTNLVVRNSYFHDAIRGSVGSIGFLVELGNTGPYLFENNRFERVADAFALDAVSNVTIRNNTFIGGNAFLLRVGDTRGGIFNVLATGNTYVGATKYGAYGTISAMSNIVLDGTVVPDRG
jgi:hypothetical protein